MAWAKLDANQKARLTAAPSTADSVLGPEPDLDDSLISLIDRYWELRDRAGPDRGVDVEGEDAVAAAHLRAMDRAFFKMRAEVIQAEREALESKAKVH